MIKHQNAKPNYLHFIKLGDLPARLQPIVYQVAIASEYDMYDYSDGDFFFQVDLYDAPYSIVDDDDLKEQWMRFLKWFRGELAPDVVAANSLAIYCSQ